MRSPITVQFLDRLTCDVFVIQGSELGMEGDVTVFRTNGGGYVVPPVGQRGMGGGGGDSETLSFIIRHGFNILGFF